MDKKSNRQESSSSLREKGKKVLSNVAKKITSPQKEERRKKMISHDEIAVRAYFISERRREMGWGGDSESDWADAERQLRAEAE